MQYILFIGHFKHVYMMMVMIMMTVEFLKQIDKGRANAVWSIDYTGYTAYRIYKFIDCL